MRARGHDRGSCLPCGIQKQTGRAGPFRGMSPVTTPHILCLPTRPSFPFSHECNYAPNHFSRAPLETMSLTWEHLLGGHTIAKPQYHLCSYSCFLSMLFSPSACMVPGQLLLLLAFLCKCHKKISIGQAHG